jgi:hypothetical protein
MTAQPTGAIEDYHAHVYYDADSKPAAERLREGIASSSTPTPATTSPTTATSRSGWANAWPTRSTSRR